jgi:hypothetical protein
MSEGVLLQQQKPRLFLCPVLTLCWPVTHQGVCLCGHRSAPRWAQLRGRWHRGWHSVATLVRCGRCASRQDLRRHRPQRPRCSAQVGGGLQQQAADIRLWGVPLSCRGV